MAITGLHLLLTYQCNFECDHCFVWGSPTARGIMTLSDIRGIYEEATKMRTVEWIYLEGGEPFLFYPIMLKAVREAKKLGFQTGIVTNGYWATSIEDAVEWLIPIAKMRIDDFSISDDPLHYERGDERAVYAATAARRLDIPVNTIIMEDPKERVQSMEWKGRPVIGGSVMFRGRAAEKLIADMPRKPWTEFNRCTDEEFQSQSRVHLDPFGHVHVCQGITIGNFKAEPLSKIIQRYDPSSHPICGPIIREGPVGLVKDYDILHDETYVDECHLCYSARVALRKRFPDSLAPDQMYGVEED